MIGPTVFHVAQRDGVRATLAALHIPTFETDAANDVADWWQTSRDGKAMLAFALACGVSARAPFDCYAHVFRAHLLPGATALVWLEDAERALADQLTGENAAQTIRAATKALASSARNAQRTARGIEFVALEPAEQRAAACLALLCYAVHANASVKKCKCEIDHALLAGEQLRGVHALAIQSHWVADDGRTQEEAVQLTGAELAEVVRDIIPFQLLGHAQKPAGVLQ